MNQTLTFSRTINWILFLVLLSYALLRAWFVSPMHDEAATFFHYIETGEIFSDHTLMDANNHLLNSWIGNWFYTLFGDNFFLFRLPSLACFCLYFWSSRKLTTHLKLGIWGEICFVALNTVPWISEYFSYTRGYGMAIGFFMAALLQLFLWIENQQSYKRMVLILVFLYLAVLSNLTYLVPCLLVLGYVCFVTAFFLKSMGIKKVIFHLFFFAAFCIALLPLIAFSFALKEAGALYYGSLDGIWWVTGKSLSHCILFFEAKWLRLLYLFIGFIGTILLLMQWKKESWSKFITSPSFWISMLVGGNGIAILFLAKVMKVNYPEDRAAMYLIPLCILVLTTLFSQHKWTKYGLVVLLFFPISFLVKLNLNTSIFSPDDRMSAEFYQRATKDLKPTETVSVYSIMQLTYAYMERTNVAHKTKQIATYQRYFYPSSDLILTKTTFLFPNDDLSEYNIIAQDPASTYIALKRKKSFTQKQLFDTINGKIQSTDEYILFYDGPIQREWRNKTIQINVKGKIDTEKTINTFNLVVATNNPTEQNLRYDYQNLRWYYGANHHFELNYHYAAKRFKGKEKRLVIYIWNPEREKITVSNPGIQIVEQKR